VHKQRWLANAPNKFYQPIGITLIGILTGIYSGDKITTDVSFVSCCDILSPMLTIAVGVVVVILTFLFGFR
jgi:putative hemolysin